MSILDLIDGAVEAWETSPDAMRWSPESHAEPDFETRGHLALHELLEQGLADMQLDSYLRARQAFRDDLRQAFRDDLEMTRANFGRYYLSAWVGVSRA